MYPCSAKDVPPKELQWRLGFHVNLENHFELMTSSCRVFELQEVAVPLQGLLVNTLPELDFILSGRPSPSWHHGFGGKLCQETALGSYGNSQPQELGANDVLKGSQ